MVLLPTMSGSFLSSCLSRREVNLCALDHLEVVELSRCPTMFLLYKEVDYLVVSNTVAGPSFRRWVRLPDEGDYRKSGGKSMWV